MSMCDLGRAIECGDLDPIALTESVLSRAQSHAMSSRIFTAFMEERALAEAEDATKREKGGARRGLCDVVPV
jgi:Asp-tRNA(Asn)/Glu-tRNA(Gln) amidotransferase A subunit family amidase